MKKLFTILLAAALLLALAAPALAVMEEDPFELVTNNDTGELYYGEMTSVDWNAGAWWANAMAWCVHYGYFKGTTDNRIEADRHITRAEFMAVIVRYAELTEAGDVSVFGDVTESDWFHDAVAIGYGSGVTEGMTRDLFVPYNDITREQAFAMYTRALKMDNSTESVLEQFSDNGKISPWAHDSLNTIVAYGVVGGYEDGTVRPLNPITRGEVAQILYNAAHGLSIGEEEVPLAEFPFGQGSGYDPNSYVYFYPLNGSTFFYSVISNGHVAEPAAPTRTGYTFGGWYTDPSGGYRYDFSYDPATNGMALYARWYANGPLSATQAALDALGASGQVSISVDTDIFAIIGRADATCKISYSAANANNATLRLVDAAGNDLIGTVTMTPGYTATSVTLSNIPTAADYGNSPVTFIVTPAGGGAPVQFEATLWVAYLWNLG